MADLQLPWNQDAPVPQSAVDLDRINAARAGMGLPPITPPPPASIAAPPPDLAPAPPMSADAIRAGLSGRPMPGMQAPPPPPSVSAEDRIAQSLGAPHAPLPPGVRPAMAHPGAEGPMAGKVDPSTLVGANRQGNQIPTVVTGAVGGGGGKPHMQLGAMSTQETVHNPAAIASYAAGVQGEANAVGEKTAAESAQANEIAQLGRIGNAGIDRREHEAQAREQARQAQIASETDKLKQLTSQARNGEIDESRYWHTSSTGDKIAGALAVALGAMAGGKTGTNHALDIYDRAVQRDIDEQKANLGQKNKALEDQKGLIAVMRQNFGDNAQADAAAKMAYVESFARDVQQTMRENSSALVQAQGQALLAGLQQKYGLAMDEFTKTTEAKSYHMVQPGGGGTVIAPHADIKKNEVVKGPDGKLYEFGEGATAQKAAEQIGTIHQSLEDADALSAITNNPANLADPGKRAEARAIAARLVMRNGKAEGGSATRISESAIKLAQDAAGGDPNALLNFGKSAGLAEYRRGLTSEAHGLIKQHAISSVESFQEQNARTGEQTLRFRRNERGPSQAPDLGAAEVGER